MTPTPNPRLRRLWLAAADAFLQSHRMGRWLAEHWLRAVRAAPDKTGGMSMDHDDEITGLVARIGEAVNGTDLHVACAESLTSGQIATALGAGESSSEWFRGGVVAYQRETKYRVLGVERGPVVCESAAAQMAKGVADATGARVAVAVTGVGGPDEQDGQPVGTVFIGLYSPLGVRVQRFRFEGEPVEVVRATVVEALTQLAQAVEQVSP